MRVSKRKRKIIKRIFLTVIILGLLFLHFYAPKVIIEIDNSLVEIIRNRKVKTNIPNYEENVVKGKYVQFISFDKTELVGFLTYSNLKQVKGTIILLHGIRSNKESFINLSNKLANLGYNSIALDLRAHGKSNGKYCTFGVKEKKDVSELINVLIKKEKITENIGIWGKSLGGAVGLQTLGIDKRIKFGIIESTFSDFTTITNDYANYHLGFKMKPLINYLVCRAGKIGNFNVNDAKPSKYCTTIEQPILLVHGTKDQRINIKYAKENFEIIKSKNKNFIEIEGANHLNVWKIGGDAYFNKVISFLNENTKQNTGN